MLRSILPPSIGNAGIRLNIAKIKLTIIKIENGPRFMPKHDRLNNVSAITKLNAGPAKATAASSLGFFDNSLILAILAIPPIGYSVISDVSWPNAFATNA